MVIESLERSGINIKDLVLEEPQKPTGLPYDIRDCITQEHLKRLENLPPADQFERIDNFQRGLLILFPDRFPVKSLKKDVLLAEFKDLQVRQDTEAISLAEHATNKYRIAANMKFLFPGTDFFSPDEWEQLGRMFTDPDTRLLEGSLDFSFALGIFFRAASYIQMISPQKAQEFKLDDEKIWREGIKQLKYDRTRKQYYSFINLAFYMKIINPNRMKDFTITAEDWEGMREYFEKGIDLSGIDACIDTAAKILFLQAEEIKMSPRGVKIVMPVKQSFTQNIPPIPQVRRF